jgi:hypothetical protein
VNFKSGNVVEIATWNKPFKLEEASEGGWPPFDKKDKNPILGVFIEMVEEDDTKPYYWMSLDGKVTSRPLLPDSRCPDGGRECLVLYDGRIVAIEWIRIFPLKDEQDSYQ